MDSKNLSDLKKFALTAILAVMVTTLNAQDGANTKAEEKEILIQMANERNLVIEATAMYGRHGFNAFDIGPNNFISIDSNRFVLQTSNTNSISQNGLGGVTIRGNISSYDVRPGKGKRPPTIIAQVNTYGFGFATVTIRLFGLKNAQATFMNAQTTLTLSGPVTTIENSYVYKGIDAY